MLNQQQQDIFLLEIKSYLSSRVSWWPRSTGKTNWPLENIQQVLINKMVKKAKKANSGLLPRNILSFEVIPWKSHTKCRDTFHVGPIRLGLSGNVLHNIQIHRHMHKNLNIIIKLVQQIIYSAILGCSRRKSMITAERTHCSWQ